MKSRSPFSFFLVFVLILVFASGAWADSYHYRNIIVGDRASGMGGAFTAIADDPSGIFYNPSGMVYSQGTNVSASANAYHNTSKKYSNVLGGQGWERKASSLLPNFFGVVQKAGKGRLGFAYVVPDSVREDQDQVFHNITEGAFTVSDYTLNFNNEDNTNLFGMAYAREINKSLSWGFSLFYHHRRIQSIFNEVKEYTDGSSYWYNRYYESEEDGIKPVFGMMWTPAEKISFGASISKTILTGSRTMSQETLKDKGNLNAVVNIVKSGSKREYPININVGGAYFASEAFLVTLDVNYFTEERDDLDIEKTWVANFALGTEYYFSPNLAMRFGLYSNMSAAPEIESGVTSVTEDDVDLFGGTLSFSHFGRGSSLTMGLAYSTGSGDAQVTNDNTEIQTADISSWTIYLSNAYGF